MLRTDRKRRGDACGDGRPKPARVACALFSVALSFLPEFAVAQESEALEFRPCDGCAIEVSPLAVLGVTDQVAFAAPMDDGRIAVVQAYDRLRFSVLDAGGAVVRHVGRAGEGPGEYADVTWLEVQGDLVHVVDGSRRQVTVLDAASDFEVLSTIRLPVPGATGRDMVVLGDSGYVANMMVFTRDRIGYVLHYLDANGKVLQSFDEPGGPVRGMGIVEMRWLRAGNDGTVWSVPMTRYRVDQWAPASGERLRSFERRAEWFPDHDGEGASPRRPDRPPAPVVIGVDVDSSGHVWVMTSVAVAERWEESLIEVGERAHAEMPEYELPADRSIVFDTVVEVIDPATGRVVAARTFDEPLYGLGGGRVFTTSPGDAPFTHRHELWQLRLVVPEEEGR